MLQKVNFFNGLLTYAKDWDLLQQYFEERINFNMTSFTKKGVVVGADLPNGITLQAPYVWHDNSTLGVYGLVAYDSSGRFIYVEPKYQDGALIPTVSNLKYNPVTQKLEVDGTDLGINQSYTMVIRYSEKYSTESEDQREQYDSKILMPVRINVTFELYLRPIGGALAGDVILGKVTTDNFGNISVDESERDTFTIIDTILRSQVDSAGADGQDVTLHDHINMLGSGTWSRTNPHAMTAQDLGIDPAATGMHQQYLHSDGIKTNDRYSTNSALYPYYLTSALTSEEKLIICPLTDANNEILVANGKTLTSKNLTNEAVFDFSLFASSNYKGYYLFVVDSLSGAISKLGPYNSDTDPIFISNASTRDYFPICSIYWGPNTNKLYSITLSNEANPIIASSSTVFTKEDGTPITAEDLQVPVTSPVYIPGTEIWYRGMVQEVLAKSQVGSTDDSYNFEPLSFKDRRVFNNTSFSDLRREVVTTLRDGAPIVADTIQMFNARVKATNKLGYFSLGGLTFEGIFDDTPYPPLTFLGQMELSIDEVVDQLNGWLTANYVGTGNPPMAVIAHDGYISILASKNIIIDPSGTANGTLGFSSATNNMQDESEDIRCVIYSKPLPSMQEMYYDANDNLTDVFYVTNEGNQIRSHSLEYNDAGFVSKVTENVEVR